MSSTEYVQIKDMKPGMKNINIVFIVLDVSPPTITKENREVRTLRVADATATINLSMWDEPGALLFPGDIVRLTRGYAGLWRNALTLYTGKCGDIQKIDEFCMLFNEQVNMSEVQPAPPPSAVSAPPPRITPTATAAPPPHKSERFPAERASPAPQDNKIGHKTYVRGRGGMRGGARR